VEIRRKEKEIKLKIAWNMTSKPTPEFKRLMSILLNVKSERDK